MDGRDISDQNVTFIFFQNGHQQPFWTSEINFLFAFPAISDQNAIFFFKWPPAAILDVRFSPKVYDKPFYAKRLTQSGTPQAKYV